MNDKQEQALRDLYRHSRQEQPSSQLDERIRQAAMRARYRRTKRWIWGLSTAAMLVLSFNVALNLLQLEPGPDPVQIITQQNKLASVQPKVQPVPQQEAMMDSMQVPAPQAPAYSAARELEAQKSLEMKERTASNFTLKRALTNPESVLKRDQRQDFSSGLLATDQSMTQLSIPQLPIQLDPLLRLNAGLTGEKTASGIINIYSLDKLILRVDSRSAMTIMKAWPGAEILGVRVNWNIKPSGLEPCKADIAYITCRLGASVEGLFEQQRLDHITWRVSND